MSRRRAQAGFTVVELLVAMLVLSIVATGAVTLMQVVLRQSGGVVERTEAAQRGRLALDAITRQIRSQVCRDEATRGLIAATPNRLHFYADLSGAATPAPVEHQIEYLPAQRRIVERVFPPGGGAARERRLLEGVDPAPGRSFFTYYAYPDPLPAEPTPDVQVPGTQIGRIARIEVAFTVLPVRGQARHATRLSDGVQLRNADPNGTSPNPTCL